MAMVSAPTSNTANVLSSALNILTRIAPVHHRHSFDISALTAQPVRPQPATIEHLAISLVDMGLPADRTTLAVAESFARVGVPITNANISAARATLVRVQGSSPAAIALASAIGVPQSPGVLRSLATVVQGLPQVADISPEAAQQIAIKISDSTSLDDLTLQVHDIVSRLSQSAESRIYRHEAIVRDPRIALLSLSHQQTSHARGADHLARHVEGQQVLNTAAYQVAIAAPLYFGFYAIYPGGRMVPIEAQILRILGDDAEEEKEDAESEETRLTIRVTTSRLGSVEVKLAVKTNRQMRCELRAHSDLACRLFRRFAPALGRALVTEGWDVRQISVVRVRDFNPLWFGGDSLTQPRHRMDSRV
ncbi:MAG: hypothetical protein P4L33_10200 [Capsulimonadaceae bacterium]|nr:hypothetical protein [Capsulimonadaceae bacterium]